MTIEHKRSSKAEIEDLIKARYSLIWVTSPEETRVEESLKRLCVEREMRLEVWSITEGFKTVANGQGTRDVKDPMKAIDHVLRAEGRALFVLRDFHPFLKEPAVVRRLRDAATDLRKTKKSLCVLSPTTKIPPELEKSISAVLDWDLPNRQEIEAAARKVLPALPAATQQVIESDPQFMERVVESALGLTLVEAENVFAKSAVRTHTFDLETILEEKKQIIRKSGLLEYYEHREEFSDVGGMEILKDWLVKRRAAFGSRAKDFGLPLPKGILLIGVPGTGKSLTAKAVGALWQMPLLRLDVGKIFAGLVGSSEENMRSVIKTAEAIAPAILWIDELEKGFSGTQSSGSTDGGTTSRVFSTFITWLQEKTTPVFVIATANNVHQLPPELLRKGRFDEILLLRSAGSRGSPPDPRHPSAQEESRPGPVRHGPARRRDDRLLGRRARASGDRRALRRVRLGRRPHDRGPREDGRRDRSARDHDARDDRLDARVGTHPSAHGVGTRQQTCQTGGLDGALRRLPPRISETRASTPTTTDGS